jgi:hypothetical protein
MAKPAFRDGLETCFCPLLYIRQNPDLVAGFAENACKILMLCDLGYSCRFTALAYGRRQFAKMQRSPTLKRGLTVPLSLCYIYVASLYWLINTLVARG